MVFRWKIQYYTEFLLNKGWSLDDIDSINRTIGKILKYDPLNKPNTYNIPDNPNYWKNKMPYEGYWQQDVHYEINAEINAEDNTIYANQTLTYWNNSPDELDYVYFHLYQNAFKEDSYYTELKK